MTTWFLAALLATFLWAVVVLIDDNLLKNVYRTATFGAIVSGLFGFIPSFYLFVTNEKILWSPSIVVPAIAAGVLTVIFYYFYFRMLAMDEPSVAIALLSLAPAMVPFLAYAFLGESLRSMQYVGLGLIVLMAFVISLIDAEKLKFSKAVPFAIAASLAFAFDSLLLKYAYDQAAFRDVYVWVTFGFGIGGLAFFTLGMYKDVKIKKIVSRTPIIIVTFLIVAEIINASAEWVQGYAISNGPVSLVRGVEGVQPIFILIIGLIMAPFFPKRFRERVDGRLPRKVIAMIGMAIGLFLMQV